MWKLKADFDLTKLIVYSLFFICIIFSTAIVKAQSPADDSYEKELFEKLYPIVSDRSVNASKKLESLFAGLKTTSVSNKTNAQIIRRLGIEAAQIAESDLQKADIFWKVAELLAAQNDDRSALANAIYYRANTLAALDKYKEALAEYQRAIEVFKDKPVTDQEKSVICEIYAAAGETAETIDEETARNFFEKGWEILTGVKDWKKSQSLIQIARILLLGQGNEGRQSGDYSLATAKFSEALSLPGSDNFLRAEMLWELGKLKRDTGDFSAGAADFSEAIKLLDKTAERDETERLNLQVNLYNSLGLLMLEQRFSKGAEQNLNQALILARSLKDLRFEGTILKNLSIAARQKRDYHTARTRALAAMEIAVSTDFNDLNISANNILAGLAQTTGDHREAIERLQKSVVLAEKSRNVLRVVESKWRLAESLFVLQKYNEAKKLAQESLSAARKNQWGNLIYLSATLVGRSLLKDENFSAAEEMFELAIGEIEQKRRQVAGAEVEKVSFMGDKATAYHELLKLRVKNGDTDGALAIAEKLKSRVLEEKVGGRKKIESNSNSFSMNIPAETVIVSYTVTDEECLAFVFTPQRIQPKIHIIPADEKTLTEKIRRFRAGLLKFDPTFKSQAGELYRLLLKNLESEIGDVKNLIIIPDGALWELPFQALITSEQKYLIERYGVSYAPSLNTLNYLQSSPSPEKQNQFLAFANSMPSAPLPETEKEVDAVSKHYGKVSVFKSLAATETRFKELAPQSAQIHLAVHGEINSLDPFSSALLLAPTVKEDGRLTVSEILEMNLSANLVVLSSCDTSNGQVVNGEGLLSLSWAFLASGVNDVVAAQWAVEEKATANLMSDFYRILNKNSKSPTAALREAQIKSLKLPAPLNHPFYWSGFIVIGKPD